MHDRCWTALNVSWHDFAASTVTLAKDDNLETQLNGKNTKEPQTRLSAQMRQASVVWGCLDTRLVYKGRDVGAAESGTIEEWEWMKVSCRSIPSDYLPKNPRVKVTVCHNHSQGADLFLKSLGKLHGWLLALQDELLKLQVPCYKEDSRNTERI